LDPDLGQIIWESKKHCISAFSYHFVFFCWVILFSIVTIENIKELCLGPDAQCYRQQFQLAPGYQERWLSVIYALDGQYKTLYLIATTKAVFRMWDTTLRKLHQIRKDLMSGLGKIERRQAL
jgi:phosphatidylinositol phospholipase C delta